jgi:AcrR family transcriptional regulator
MSEVLPKRSSPGGRGARARIMQAATVLFYDRGINVTGVSELAAAAQVSKRTLYQHFEGKDAVIQSYLQRLEDEQQVTAEQPLTNIDLTPRARLLALFDDPGRERHPLRGCPYVNAAVELADVEHPAHQLAADHKRRFIQQLASTAREAGARNPKQLARRLALLYDGAAAEAAVFDDTEPASAARAMAEELIAAAID